MIKNSDAMGDHNQKNIVVGHLPKKIRRGTDEF